MKILALDSSGLVASVAVLEDDNCIAEYTINYKKTQSQTLLPMLDEVSRMIELDLDSIDAIAVAAGPGSFTGLRIGSATAKGLGQALGKPLVGIPTVDGLAFNLYGTDKVHGQSDLRQLPGQDQTQITAAQDHHRPLRGESMKIHHLLHLSGGVNPSGTGAADGQCANGNLPAAGGKNQLRKGNLFSSKFLTGKQSSSVFRN